MSKNKHPATETSVGEAAASAPAAVETAAAAETVVATEAIAVQAAPATTAVAVAEPQVRWQTTLAKRLTDNTLYDDTALANIKDDVLMLKRPTMDDLNKILAQFPVEQQDAVMEMMRKLNPKKQGDHSARSGFTPTLIKVNQGVGDDALRPETCPVGHFYTGSGDILGSSFSATILSFYEGRTLWPGRDEGGGKGPICSSMDRVVGSKYGACGACPFSSKMVTEGGCGRDVHVYLLDKGLTGVYEMIFSRTSTKSGESLVKLAKKSSEVYDRWYTFSNEKRVDGDKRWYIPKATPSADPKDAVTSPAHKKLAMLFSQWIDADVYWPGRAGVLERYKSAGESPGAAVMGDTFKAQDFSGNTDKKDVAF